MNEKISIYSTISFLIVELFFLYRGTKKLGESKKETLLEQKIEVLMIAIVEPWNTKYKWGGIVQLILFTLMIVGQF